MSKKVLIAGFVGLMLVAIAAASLRGPRITYHKWRLAVAIENTQTAGAGKPTKTQELVAMLRGRTASAEEYVEAWQRHEDALVKLNYLARREFDLGRRASTDIRLRISEAAERAFCGRQLWSVANSASNEHALIITAPPEDMPEWERLMNRLQGQAQFARRSGQVKPPQAQAH